MNPTYFQTYRIARERFLEATEQAHGKVNSLIHPQKGPEQEELSLDVAQTGDPQAKRVIVISSGLHGAEAQLGSAVQLAILEYLKSNELPTDVRIVLLHALNPWGFAYVRRVDEQNVDGNRNFLIQGESYQTDENELYGQLDQFLNPADQSQLQRSFLLQAGQLLLKHPYQKVFKAIASGQNRFPHGLFYGGDAPNWTTRQFTEYFPAWIAGATHCCHLDFHTGLGKYGRGELLIDTPLDEQTQRWLKEAYSGESLHSFHKQNEPPYQARGSISRWVHSNSTASHTISACAEFGTYSSLKMLKTLRQENYYAQFGAPDSKAFQSARKKLQEAFCPSSNRWRQNVLERGVSLIRSAIENVHRW
ncbi:DUF2817 domain-containing protein [Rubinisphaera italica]|uniref:Zinc carboxypeptidase n=1 Tax=Rubinisphaera italica TaxID=2527969 RepID=A0A5C5XGD8_9PLAN|nr:DUF2817 domain-containing protein [Rubinisphaera italica]TWT62080.1 Zinc carboxypeptidase [Rubinisphaera italica]